MEWYNIVTIVYLLISYSYYFGGYIDFLCRKIEESEEDQFIRVCKADLVALCISPFVFLMLSISHFIIIYKAIRNNKIIKV